MMCPFCNASDSKVLDSRLSAAEQAIRRRRQCVNCEQRYTTYERCHDQMLWVKKSDGSHEAFDPSKIMAGLVRAAAKRPLSKEALSSVVVRIESTLRNQGLSEINSHAIGQLVLKELSLLDDVAYVRFASVYQHFDSVKSFVEALNVLTNKPLSDELAAGPSSLTQHLAEGENDD